MLQPQAHASLTKFSEYLAASVLRRDQIIRDQRDPKTFIVNRYQRAEAAALEYLAAGGDARVLERAVRELERLRDVARNENERIGLACSVSALEALPAAVATLELSGASVRSCAHQRHRRMRVGGTRVSVQPHLRLEVSRRSRASTGAIKLYFSKEFRLSQMAGRYAAGQYGAWLLREYVRREWCSDGALCDERSCYVVDVFGQCSFIAPRADVTCRRVLEVGGREFAANWKAR